MERKVLFLRELAGREVWREVTGREVFWQEIAERMVLWREMIVTQEEITLPLPCWQRARVLFLLIRFDRKSAFGDKDCCAW